MYFPSLGNFKFVGLVHEDMTGVVHVVSASTPMPHDQNDYAQQAIGERLRLLASAASLGLAGTLGAQADSVGPQPTPWQDCQKPQRVDRSGAAAPSSVCAGIGEIVNMTGLGSETASLMRFVGETIFEPLGGTVEWSNLDPSINHTVTFGTEPADPRPASTNVQPSSDGAR